MNARWVVTICLGISIFGCATRGEYRIENPNASDHVISVPDGDREMNAAVQKAKDTIKDFIEDFQHQRGTFFAVKTPLPDSDGNFEHIWVEVKSFDKDVFFGVIDSEPWKLPGKKLGDKIEVQQADITDWLISDNGKIKGAYTTEVLNRKTQKE